MKTPTSALDLADVSETVPATPASSATTTLKTSGLATNAVSGRWPSTYASGTCPAASSAATARAVVAIATANPTSTARDERLAWDHSRARRATATPASGPNSGP